MLTTCQGDTIAPFCSHNIIGEVTFVKKGQETTSILWRCRHHDMVTLVRFVNANSVQYVACPDCLDVFFKGKIASAEPLEESRGSLDVSETCADCVETNNLQDCDMCGITVCPRHRVEGSCNDCAKTSGYLCCGPF
jgi:hypothetical protein